MILTRAVVVFIGLSNVAAVGAASSTPAGSNNNAGGRIVKSIFNNGDEIFEKSRRLVEIPPAAGSGPILPSYSNRAVMDNNRNNRKLDDDQQANCDASFLNCLPDYNCVDCFATLELEGIDWTGVTPNSQCTDVVQFLFDGGHCNNLEGDKSSVDIFCATFDACVIWEDWDAWDDDAIDPEDRGGGQFDPEEGWVNCTALTECDWPGMKKGWLGDGICNDNMHGCYNTALCNYDNGDCCADTCVGKDTEYHSCGSEGYMCRNPNSDDCDSYYTTKCKSKATGGGSSGTTDTVKCDEDQQKYRLNMYDSFGDGWDTTKLTVKDGNKEIYSGSLLDGFQGTEYICLSKTDPACYSVDTTGGTWGVEVTWDISPLRDGLPSIAEGGAPDNCDFPIAGAECEKTCSGKPDTDPTQDDDYKSFKLLYNCIKDKCVIQLGACQADETCEKCFDEDAPDYCYGIDTFVAVIDCTMCSCTDKEDSDYCNQKRNPNPNVPDAVPMDDDGIAPPAKCSPAQTMAGAKAVMNYAECGNFDETGVMITQFDQNNFGQLDQFEACAHAYADSDNHGGHTALGCMGILQNAISNPVADGNEKNPPLDAISALANDLYNNAENFCDCTKTANEDCPLCPSFMSFKTLLYESIDACVALDEIDCAAWGEFWKPCKDNLEANMGGSNFKDKDQCDYAKNGCGGVGAFPAFRRLDCDNEVEKDAWAFYRSFESKCLRGDDGIPPNPAPVAFPTKPPTRPTPAPVVPSPVAPAPSPVAPSGGGNSPTLKPYIPSDGGKPYTPSDSSSASDPSKTKKKSHWFRNLILLCLLGGGGYYIYKKRFDTFNFVQYRRMGRNFNMGNGMYGGNGGFYGGGGMDHGSAYTNLNQSTTFEPPTLPPTPTMMGTEMT